MTYMKKHSDHQVCYNGVSATLFYTVQRKKGAKIKHSVLTRQPWNPYYDHFGQVSMDLEAVKW